MSAPGTPDSPATAVTGARLRAAREAAGLSLSDLAARIPYSRAALGHYETGRRPCPSEVVTWYERECGRFADPVTTVSVLGRADVDRRSFLRKAAYSAALTATALAALPDAARLAQVTDSTRVGLADIEALQGITDALLRLDEVRGGGFGRSTVAEFLSTDVSALLRSRFATTEVRARAFSAASELAYLAGFKAHDAGQDGLSQRYFLSALRLAEESGTPGQDGFAFRILALHGNDVRQPRNGVALAERAISRARGHVGPDTMSLFTTALARCQAEAGDRPAALATLRAAEPWLVPDPPADLPRWAALFCPNKASVARQSAKAFLAAGEVAEAERLTFMSSQIWNPVSHTRIHALTLAETGLLRWQMGQHEDAAKLWRGAVPTLHGVESDRAVKVLAKVRRAAPEIVGAGPDPGARA